MNVGGTTNSSHNVSWNQCSHHVEWIGGSSHDAPYDSSNGTECAASGSNACYGLYNKGDDNLVERVSFYNNSGYGVHNYCSGCAADRAIYRYNLFYGNGAHVDQVSGALLIGSCDGCQAYGNVIRDNHNDGLQISNGSTNAIVYSNTVSYTHLRAH